MEDWQLLSDYLTTGSETAFRELVERHVRLVHATAQRQVNNAALSEEITQAVFILLARKAPTLSRRTVLVGWLFQTTRFVAARALRSEIRRQQREQEAMAMQELSAPGETWHRLAPVIDEALEGLDAGERNAVLLRVFEERNHREVGAAVGRTVLGRVVAKSGEPLDFSIRLTRGQLEPVQQQTPKPAHLGGIAAELWLVDFWQSPEGRECARRRISWPLQLNADGTFRIEEVLPGRWQLRIFGGRTLNRPVEIPEDSGPGQEPVELGELRTAE